MSASTVLLSKNVAVDPAAIRYLQEEMSASRLIYLAKPWREITSSILISPQEDGFFEVCTDTLSQATSLGRKIIEVVADIQHVLMSGLEATRYSDHPFLTSYLCPLMGQNGTNQLLTWNHRDFSLV